MAALVAACVFCLVVLACWPFPAAMQRTARVREYLLANSTTAAVVGPRPRPTWAVLVPPVVENLIRRLRHLPPGRPDPLALQLTHAGLEDRITTEQFIALHILAPLGLFAIMSLYFIGKPGPFTLGLAIAAAIAGIFAPSQWLRQRLRARHDALRRDLPGFLTTLAVLLDAGLNLLPALHEAAATRQGPLADQWFHALRRIQLGTPVPEALEAMAAECGLSELTLFVSVLVQSLDKGAAGVSEAVRAQARQIWALRQQAVEEKGQEAAQDLFLVLLVLAFPAVAIFLLGPIGISMYRFFTHQQ